MAQPVKKALEAIGNKNKYQWVVFFIMFMLNAFVNMIIVGPTFIYMNPLFKCEGHTELVDESEACDILDQCQTRRYQTIQKVLSQSWESSAFTVTSKLSGISSSPRFQSVLLSDF